MAGAILTRVENPIVAHEFRPPGWVGSLGTGAFMSLLMGLTVVGAVAASIIGGLWVFILYVAGLLAVSLPMLGKRRHLVHEIDLVKREVTSYEKPLRGPVVRTPMGTIRALELRVATDEDHDWIFSLAIAADRTWPVGKDFGRPDVLLARAEELQQILDVPIHEFYERPVGADWYRRLWRPRCRRRSVHATRA